MNERWLILFDVDGTLIERNDPDHLAALDLGYRAAFPDAAEISVRQLDIDGKVDRQILRQMAEAAGITEEVTSDHLDRAVEAGVESYTTAWHERVGDTDLLPGVRVLLQRLAEDPRYALGVLTGGAAGVVKVKLRRLGLEQYFPIGSFGSEVDLRPQLFPLAVARAEQHYGTTFPSERVIIIGDTPHDITCARSGGGSCLAVATGKYALQELQEAGADVALADLSDAESVLQAIEGLTRSHAA